MSFEKNNPKGIFPYGSTEYEQKIKDVKIKFEDIENILCRFIKDRKEFHEFTNLYFIYKDSYVFTSHKNQVKTTYENGGYITKGIDGLYINIYTGKITIVKRTTTTKDTLIVLEKDSEDIFGKFKHYSTNCN